MHWLMRQIALVASFPRSLMKKEFVFFFDLAAKTGHIEGRENKNTRHVHKD